MDEKRQGKPHHEWVRGQKPPLRQRCRHVVQVLSALALNPHLPNLWRGEIYQGVAKGACVPVLNCYSCPAAVGACPVGALQSSLSGFMPRFPAYVLGMLLLFGLVLGRTVCGWLCPFGLLQELLYKLPGRKLEKSNVTRWLSRVKYVWAVLFVLVLPLAFQQLTGVGEPAFCKFLCPAGTFEGAVPLLVANAELRAATGLLTAWKFTVMIAFLGIMTRVYRPFCRFLCPLGAWYGLFNRHALLGVAVDPQRCVRCGACADVCKLDVTIAGDAECISCGACLHHCRTGAIYFRKPFGQRDTGNGVEV